MPRQRHVLLQAIALLSSFAVLAGGCALGAQATPSPASVPTPSETPTPAPAPVDPFEINRRLGRGVNLGNALEAPSEGAWGVYLVEGYFDLIKEGGFDSVRVPIRWSTHTAKEAPYTIDDKFFSRIDWVVDQCLSRDLMAVINIHHYDELFPDPAGHKERFLAIWTQIAEHYKDYPDSLVFEVLNEPHDRITAPVWNSLLKEALSIIRQTNPTRTVIIGTTEWGGINGLAGLQLPEDDRNLIVTVHCYEPFQFTHQGAEWQEGSDAWLGTTWEGTDAEKRQLTSWLDKAAKWGADHQRPIYLGEFGAYSKADMDSRARWTAFLAREAEARDISWAYWEFCSGFGVYDPALKRWNEPLLKALVPETAG